MSFSDINEKSQSDWNEIVFHLKEIIYQYKSGLLNNLSWLPDAPTMETNLLTKGSKDFSTDQNENISKHVYEYIKTSKMFLIV